MAATGVDGCGAPLFAVSLTGVARAFHALVRAAPGSPERRVADAMRKHPEWTSGTNRDERRLMAAMPGLLVKSGAEGVDAFAFAAGSDVFAGAIKIEDGARRARTPVTVSLLRALGGPAAPDLAAPAVLAEPATVALPGGDGVAGVVRTVPGLFG